MKKITILFIFLSSFLLSQSKVDTLDLSEYPVRFSLSQQINETSGVEYFNQHLYTFNDSGGKPEIYKLNPENGEILQTIWVNGAKNKDWEEIARKGDTLFIGDFGNNLGIRKDLTIYSIRLPEKDTIKKTETPILNTLHFTFEDQTDFTNQGYTKTNFDCEAFVYYQGKLHLFSKRWGDNQTTHYELDLYSSDTMQTAKKIETFNTECVITGADIYENELYLIGYSNYNQGGLAYVWKFTDFSEGKFFNGKSKKTLLGFTAAISQTEAIAVTENKIYITGEEMKYSLFYAPPSLYILDKSEL